METFIHIESGSLKGCKVPGVFIFFAFVALEDITFNYKCKNNMFHPFPKEGVVCPSIILLKAQVFCDG